MAKVKKPVTKKFRYLVLNDKFEKVEGFKNDIVALEFIKTLQKDKLAKLYLNDEDKKRTIVFYKKKGERNYKIDTHDYVVPVHAATPPEVVAKVVINKIK